MKILALAILVVAAAPATAVTLTFDGPQSGDLGFAYQGYYWDNFTTVNTTNLPVSGYAAAVVSPDNVIANGGSNPATLTAPGTFFLESGYLGAGWRNGITVQLDGYLGGSLVFTQTFFPTSTAATFYAFNGAEIDAAVFSSFGGTQNPAYAGIGDGSHFALDNLTLSPGTYVPEPASWALLTIGFGVVGGAMRRRPRTPLTGATTGSAGLA